MFDMESLNKFEAINLWAAAIRLWDYHMTERRRYFRAVIMAKRAGKNPREDDLKYRAHMWATEHWNEVALRLNSYIQQHQ